MSAALPAGVGGAAYVGMVDNLHGLCDSDRQAGLASQLLAIRDHGPDPCTRQQAAAHEAGHVIVGYTFGQELLSSRVQSCRGVRGAAWIGETRLVLPGRDPRTGTTSAEDPHFAFRRALDAAAGLCGEIAAGLDHPASSVDERFRTEIICRDLSWVWGLPHAQVIAMVLVLCELALAENRVAFEVIRGQLFANRRLSVHKAKTTLAKAKRFDLYTATTALLKGAGATALGELCGVPASPAQTSSAADRPPQTALSNTMLAGCLRQVATAISET